MKDRFVVHAHVTIAEMLLAMELGMQDIEWCDVDRARLRNILDYVELKLKGAHDAALRRWLLD